jgi:hypothetical protein
MHEHYTRLGEEIPLPIAIVVPFFILVGGMIAGSSSEALIWFVGLGFCSSYLCGRVRRYKWSAAYFFLFDLTWPGIVIYYFAGQPPSGVGLFPDSKVELLYRVLVSAVALLSFFEQSLWNASRLSFFFSLSRSVRLLAILAIFVLFCSTVEFCRRRSEGKEIRQELVASFPPVSVESYSSIPTFLPAPKYSSAEVDLLRRFGQRELDNKRRQKNALALMLAVLPVGLTAAFALHIAAGRAKPRVEDIVVE